MRTHFVDRGLLVTRTGREGANFTKQLQELGFNAMHLPLLALGPVVDSDALRSEFNGLPPIDGLILTSREGVRQSVQLGFLDQFRNTPTVVPGLGTAELARGAGLERVSHPVRDGGNSEAMLASEALKEVGGQHWLIMAADDGRRLLDAGLSSRGAHVHRLTVYERQDVEPTDQELDRMLAIRSWVTLLASGGSLKRLAAGLPAEVWSNIKAGTLIVPSERLRVKAAEQGVSDLVLSAGAGDEAMLAALRRCTSPP